MERVENRLLQSAVVAGLCGAALMGVVPINAVWAAPPAAPRATFHLDLHPSVAAFAAASKTGMEQSAERFPSSLHRPPGGVETQMQLPDLGAQVTQARIPSRMEEFARRVHKEGLPVARLWENKSALLSLGLNQKGKPGLWIVQKTR
jgi:hypothetical protein